ncbi:MAG: hypothetical protein NPIRA03_07870 [Nitrospirales bacterium]|nr:MAG: hypothetical protein NPIRA03_07870 [Nitrospirales bacterium]
MDDEESKKSIAYDLQKTKERLGRGLQATKEKVNQGHSGIERLQNDLQNVEVQNNLLVMNLKQKDEEIKTLELRLREYFSLTASSFRIEEHIGYAQRMASTLDLRTVERCLEIPILRWFPS